MSMPSKASLALALAALLLAGCATRSPAPRDGPHPNPPPNLAAVPDAVPRLEPQRSGGPNKPYEVLGRRWVPFTDDRALVEQGLASWYGRAFHGKPTALGEPYDMFAMTAAHKTMPLPSYARVRNPANGREVVVRINDRGPFADGRVIDLSYTAALRLGLLAGVAPVEVRRITRAEIAAGWAAAPGPAGADDLAPGDAVAGGAAGAGFWLQLGAFRSRDGAEALRQRVLQAEPGIGVRVFAEDGLLRVQAGPLGSRADAEALGQRLRARLDSAGVVVWRGPGGPGGPGGPPAPPSPQPP
jgi:rare lipoprotein A